MALAKLDWSARWSRSCDGTYWLTKRTRAGDPWPNGHRDGSCTTRARSLPESSHHRVGFYERGDGPDGQAYRYFAPPAVAMSFKE